jgi:ubiquinone/menaquinone biosynthesis C-methylase UbiE
MTEDSNLKKYLSEDVVQYYRELTELQPVEPKLFNAWLKPGLSILDMGVGAGRTTPALSSIAGRYVGADYSHSMVSACRVQWPNLLFEHCDATDMAQFSDGEFDAVVFSFNGIDEIRTDEERARCLSETARVLKAGGIYIFSSHNARIIGIWPNLSTAKGIQIPWRIVRAIGKTATIAPRMLLSRTWWNQEGYIRDSVHGGMIHYVSTPQTMKPQLTRAGFEVVDIKGGEFPCQAASFLTPWYYYACRKVVHPSR